MKKILFTLLVLAFVGCESGIGTGELYLRKLGNDRIVYSIYTESGDSITEGWIIGSMYIELPIGKYKVSASGVNIWEGKDFYMKDHTVTIRKDEVTILDIAF